MLEATLNFIKSTKNTFRYDIDDDVAVKSIYVQRQVKPDPPPKKITVTISYEK